jgi:hypothetical protein
MTENPTGKKVAAEQPAVASLRQPPRHKVVSLRELGQNLPVGMISGDHYERSFATRPFRLKEEKQIGEFRGRARGLTAGRLVSEILATMCTHIGTADFNSMKHNERLLHISRMYLMDVLYVYFYLRINALGGEIPISIVCPSCRHPFNVKTDLNDLDVRVLEDGTQVDLSFDYELRDGIEIRGKEGKVLTVGFIPWQAMDVPDLEGESGLNPANRDAALLKAGIQKVNGEPITMLDTDVDNLTLYDKAGLMDTMTEAILGPVLMVEATCPRCTQLAFQPIDWSYDSFFKRSSRSGV